MTISEIKKQAKENVSFQWGGLLLTYLILVFLTTISNAVPAIGVVIVSGPLAVGFYHIYYQASQKEKVNQWDIFKGFENCFGESVLMCLLMTLFTFLWSLLFVIPGIIKSISYSMAPYIMMREPEISGHAAVKKSMEYMKGEKWNFFVLQLSFIGWIILTVITCGLVSIYSEPYLMQATTVFYNNLYDKRKAEEAARKYAAEFAASKAEPGETIIDAEFTEADSGIDPKLVVNADEVINND